jgi:hypothetical protein
VDQELGAGVLAGVVGAASRRTASSRTSSATGFAGDAVAGGREDRERDLVQDAAGPQVPQRDAAEFIAGAALVREASDP